MMSDFEYKYKVSRNYYVMVSYKTKLRQTADTTTYPIEIVYIDSTPFNHLIIDALLWEKKRFLISSYYSFTSSIDHFLQSGFPDVLILNVDIEFDEKLFDFIRFIRNSYTLIELPIIITSSSIQQNNLIRALEMGINDYIIKPLRSFELEMRIQNHITIRDHVRQENKNIKEQILLQSILPSHIIDKLTNGETFTTESHENVTVLFTDICGFTSIASQWPVENIIKMLNDMFTRFDDLTRRHTVYKVETIGDAYMAVIGHMNDIDVCKQVELMVLYAFDILKSVAEMNKISSYEEDIGIRVGINTGPAHSGVVGKLKPRYCFFGDTINTASRMESNGARNRIHISNNVYKYLNNDLKSKFSSISQMPIKGKGLMRTWLSKEHIE